jgi:F0F1-type ATP synthase membrane subunit a
VEATKMANIIDEAVYIVIGIVLLIVAWTVYTTQNLAMIPSGSQAMIGLALFILAAGLAVKGVVGLVRP